MLHYVPHLRLNKDGKSTCRKQMVRCFFFPSYYYLPFKCITKVCCYYALDIRHVNKKQTRIFIVLVYLLNSAK